MKSNAVQSWKIMGRVQWFVVCLFGAIIVITSCSKSLTVPTPANPYAAVEAAFGSNIDLNNLANYANQNKPAYITKDNTTAGDPITDAKATVGRALFYDKNLSVNNTIACGSCHKQQFAFGDTAVASNGVLGGVAARHTMRLVDNRFADEVKYFWDERAATLEDQTIMPIQNFDEMGYSGTNGRPGFTDLLTKLEGIEYYKELFKFVFGDTLVTQTRIQQSLASFVRTIQSFDSKYDTGRAQVPSDNVAFPNFTAQENEGKQLFVTPPVFDANGVRTGGGLGCAGCHRPPEFDIDPQTGDNGIIGKISGTGIDITVVKAPSLRDVMNTNGLENGPFMHTGNLDGIRAVIGHYGNIVIAAGNTNLDKLLTPHGVGQQLNLTQDEVNALIAFMKTLSGTDIYTDTKWSDPFKQ
jgi:cytochrome c peroxidase